jgi:hypothetical protein
MLAFFGGRRPCHGASMHERMVKLGSAIVLGCLTVVVFADVVFGLYGFAKPTFFWYEFFPRPGTLRDLSFFIADHSRWPAWIVYGLSLAGALHAALRGDAGIRPMARSFLAFVLANLAVVLMGLEGAAHRLYRYSCLSLLLRQHAAAATMGWLNLRIGMFRPHRRAGMVALCALP